MKRLNRFTTLPVLLDFLEREKLVLLNPSTWDDKNDSEIMEEYRKRKGLSNICALCFSYESETIHHWKTFSDGISGCVIEFDSEILTNIFDRTEGVHHRVVEYKKMNGVSKNNINVPDIPFTKRWLCRYEKEYRVIWEGNSSDGLFEIEAPVSCVKKLQLASKCLRRFMKLSKRYLRNHLKTQLKKYTDQQFMRIKVG